MPKMTVFELLGIESGDVITVDNPRSDKGPREVIPLALSRNEISIRAIDCRYGDICYISAEWTIFCSNEKNLKLQDFPYIAQQINNFQSGKSEPKKIVVNISLEKIEREFASLNEVLDTIKLDNLKVAITGTLPLSRSDAKALLESKGAKVVGSVNKQTSYLFMGNTGHYEITEKMKKAYDLGVKIITL